MAVFPRIVTTVFAVVIQLVTSAIAQEPRRFEVAGVSFILPPAWKPQPAPDATRTGVIFIGDGGAAGRLTVSRLPAPAGTPRPLPANLDAMTAPETSDFRQSLEESGLTPLTGMITSAVERDAVVDSIAYRCQVTDTRDVVVLTATWRTPREALRARLQFPEGQSAAAAAELSSLRSSVRFRGAQTLGFTDFRRNATIASRSAFTEPAPLSPPTLTPQRPGAPGLAILNVPGQAAASPPVDTGQLVHEFSSSLVFIEGGGGAGSGFIARTKEGAFLFTNQHVVAGMPGVRFTRIDNSIITTSAIAAAVGHDIMRFTIGEAARPLVASDNVEAEARIGDDIVVLGNAEGARVIQPLLGKLAGIGPDRVEITAEFLPGNSGSPIVHVKSGKVIGVVTFLVKGRYGALTDSGEAKVRRFGYRLDTVRQWQPVAWGIYQAENATIDKVSALTRDLGELIDDISGDSKITFAAHGNAALARPVRDLSMALNNRTLSVPDRTRAVQSFLASIRNLTQNDVNTARQQLRYDFFRRELKEQSEIRDKMFQLFDRVLKGRP